MSIDIARLRNDCVSDDGKVLSLFGVSIPDLLDRLEAAERVVDHARSDDDYHALQDALAAYDRVVRA